MIKIKHCFGILFPMMYLEFSFELGIHPNLNKYISMFIGVFRSFIGYFLVYLPFLFTFAFGFGMMLPLADPNENADWPSTAWLLLPKVIVMFTGEQEFMDIPFSSDEAPGLLLLELLFCLVFLVLMVVILLNLLNALAVKDAGQMLDTAEMDKLSSLLNTIAFIDDTVFSANENKVCNMLKTSTLHKIMKEKFSVFGKHSIFYFLIFKDESHSYFGYEEVPWNFDKGMLKIEENGRTEFFISHDIACLCKNILMKRKQNMMIEDKEKNKHERVHSNVKKTNDLLENMKKQQKDFEKLKEQTNNLQENMVKVEEKFENIVSDIRKILQVLIEK